MSLIDVSGITRGVGKLGNAVVMTVQPVANIIEIASASSNNWTIQHAADLAAKTERQTAIREKSNEDLLRKALASAAQATIDTNNYVRAVQITVDIDAFKERIHNTRRKAIHDIDEATIRQLAKKENLTDADILRAAKVGSQAAVKDDTAEVVANPSEFDISQFQPTTVAQPNGSH